jgi:flagellar biosynthesis/type III secretory pathway M-ring protein FliF/YscJ
VFNETNSVYDSFIATTSSTVVSTSFSINDVGNGTSSSSTTQHSQATKSTISTPVIIGIVIGAVLLLAVIALVTFLLTRKRHRQDTEYYESSSDQLDKPLELADSFVDRPGSAEWENPMSYAGHEVAMPLTMDFVPVGDSDG